MKKFVVREVEYGGDVDVTGPERWAGTAIAWFDTEAEALVFAENYCCECDVFDEILGVKE